jgi:phosphoglycolate phosphatase
MAGNGKPDRKLEMIVFDFDGTLAELHLDFGDMKRRLAELAGMYLRGVPCVPSVRALEWSELLAASIEAFNEAGAMEFRRKADELVVRMELDSAERGRLFSFTRPMLTELNERGIETAIITRNCEAAVRFVFRDMDRYCGTFLAREHVPRVKPDPDHLLRALNMAGADPAGALMVGDHPIDVETGKSAGVRTAGVWSGSAPESDLLSSGADWVAGDCGGLMEVLRSRELI